MPSLAGRRVAVVGGTGFIGSHLVERLIAEGADVLALARSASRLSYLSSVRGECVVGLADVCDAAAVAVALARFRPTVVFHLAAHPDANETFAHVAECLRINGLGLVNTLQAAAAAGAEVFVYGASAKDYGNAAGPYRASQPASPICSYAIVKSAGWDLCRLAASFTSLKVVALRPTFVYGRRQSRNVVTYVQECVSSGQPVRLMGGSQTRDPLYIDDAVRAFIAAAVSPAAWGQAIPIGGGQELSVTSLCEAVVGALGSSVPVVSGAELSRATEIWRSSSDNVDAFRLLGWEPRVTLSEGLSRTLNGWFTGEQAIEASVRPRTDCYLATVAQGLMFRMLDRRLDVDRRGVARGGRRAADHGLRASVTRSVPLRPTLVSTLCEPAAVGDRS